MSSSLQAEPTHTVANGNGSDRAKALPLLPLHVIKAKQWWIVALRASGCTIDQVNRALGTKQAAKWSSMAYDRCPSVPTLAALSELMPGLYAAYVRIMNDEILAEACSTSPTQQLTIALHELGQVAGGLRFGDAPNAVLPAAQRAAQAAGRLVPALARAGEAA